MVSSKKSINVPKFLIYSINNINIIMNYKEFLDISG